MKRVLLLMIQPPGGTGVQGLRYSKLFPYTQTGAWELHFSGPDPAQASVGLEPLVCPKNHCHYSRNLSPSLQFATLKNRYRKNQIRFLFYGFLQLVSRKIEQWTGHDSFAYLQGGLKRTILQADSLYHFDLIAAKSPDFRILELGAALAKELERPLLAIYDDPHGQRDELGFYPDDSERQLRVLNQADAVLFMSPLTRDRYVDHELVEQEKTFCLTDSYPIDSQFYCRQPPNRSRAPNALASLRLVHLGNLPEWRPIDPLLHALAALEEQPGLPALQIDFYGYLYPKAQEMIRTLPQQSGKLTINVYNSVDHLKSHHIASTSDILLVMIGPRHLDNQPSKFFVYLGHHKPVLVIGPPGNPIEDLVNQLGIGVFCDVRNILSIRDGLIEIAQHYDTYQSNFDRHLHAIKRYAADAVAADLLAVFDATMEKASPTN